MRAIEPSAIVSSTNSKKRKTKVLGKEIILQPQVVSNQFVSPVNLSRDVLVKYREKRTDSLESVDSTSSGKSHTEHSSETSNPCSPVSEASGEPEPNAFWKKAGFESLQYFKSIHHF